MGVVIDWNLFPKFIRPKGYELYLNPKARYLVLDFEATGLEGGPLNVKNDLVLACWTVVDRASGTEHHRSVFGNEYQQGELLKAIREVDFVVAQNAKYELQWLKRCGLELRDVLVYCTLLGAWVEDGNERKPRNLNALALRYGASGLKYDLISKLWAGGYSSEDIPRRWLLSYCVNDVAITHEVFKAQLKILSDSGRLHLAYVRNLTAACLADIEFNGMTLDKERVLAEYKKVTEDIADLEAKLHEIAGGRNLRSNKQLAEFLFDELGFDKPKDHKGRPILTPAGAVSVRADTITKLKVTTEEQREFLELYTRYNKLVALFNKNLAFFKGVVEEHNGTFKAVLNMNVTATHRLSSSGLPLLLKGEKKRRGVQYQNLPREYKKLFESGDPDYYMCEADGAQLEFRVGADLGRDATAIQEILNEEDIHSVTAATLTAAGEFTTRQAAKSRTFRPLFGGKSGTKAEQEYCKFFVDKYKGISATQRGWALEVLATKELRTPYGMIFKWPGVSIDKRSGYISDTTSISNYPIQGLATGEIIPISLVLFWHESREQDVTVLNTVHDSIVAKVHKDSVKWYVEASKRCLTDYVFSFLREVYGYEFITPLGCGIKIARNWGDTKDETSFNVRADGTFTRKDKN